MKIRLHNEQDGVTKLGPGTRYVIWTQGCRRSCKGCMTPESRSLTGGYLKDIQELADSIVSAGREGITISGGEPFLQAACLVRLIGLIREKRDTGVIIYTGFTLEELMESEDTSVHELLCACDLLIDGEYVEELNDGRNLRGSSNQRAIPLSDRYREYVDIYGSRPAEIEFFMKENSLSMVGVPSRELLRRFVKMKL